MTHPASPPLVLLPGTLCDRRLYGRTLRALQGRARVMLPGLRDLPRPADVPQWAGRLLARLPERFVLGGFSLGGLLALELLRQAPGRVAGLVMIASNAEGGSRAGAQRSRQLWRDWQRRGAQAVARSLKPRYFHHAGQRRRHAGLVRDMAKDTPTRAARAQFDFAAQRPAGLGVLAGSRMPVLVISGAQDGLCPPPLQRRMLQARPDACWIELPRCGHFVPLEATSALNQALHRWLTGLWPDPLGAPT
jgi:pimeloyl-ACP methyl ester carboxylesterase